MFSCAMRRTIVCAHHIVMSGEAVDSDMKQDGRIPLSGVTGSGGINVRDDRQYKRDTRKQSRGDRFGTRNRFELFLMLVCFLLMVNMFTLLKLQTQVRNMNNSLNQVIAVISAGNTREEGEEALTKQEDEVINPKYQSAPAEPEAPVVDYVSKCGLSEVDKPADRTPSQVLKRLKELAEDDEIIAGIYKNNSRYTDDMLAALANNPEMADFVANFLDADRTASGQGLTDAEKKQEFPLFLQWDPRWGYVDYGDGSNIGLSGCGPTCLSMVLYYLLGDEDLTPDYIAKYSMENGYYMSGTGTAWKLLDDAAGVSGVSVSQPKASDWTLKNALDKGEILICSMKPGDFTAGGHFIVIYGYDSEGYLVNDPNCVARSREKWPYEKLDRQIKHLWCFGKTD